MTQTTPNEIPTTSHKDTYHPPTAISGELSDMSDSQPNSEPASENEAGDVRKKLKQTSLQQIPKLDATESTNAHRHVNTNSDSTMTHEYEDTPNNYESKNSEDQKMGSQPEDTNVGAVATGNEPNTRGRTVIKKRSREDMESSNDSGVQVADIEAETAGIHARKRSRDIRSGELKSEIRKHTAHSNSLKEEDENNDVDESIRLSSDERKPNIEMTTPPSETEGLDDEMHETVLSPKKKRSRDEMDTEVGGELKSAATEKTKRRRSSSEEHRMGDPHEEESDPNAEKGRVENGSVVKPQGSSHDESESSSSKIPTTSGFANTSAVSPFGALAGSKSPVKPLSSFASIANSQQNQTSSPAFVASGFAALSNASASPFGALGASPGKGLKSPSFSPPTLSSAFALTGKPSEEAANQSGFAALSPKATDIPKSVFGSSSVSGFGGFGSGTGFVGSLGASSKLASFAAAEGDAILGSTIVKPIGTTTEDDEAQDGEDTKDDDNLERGLDNDEPDPRFQVQEINTGEEHEHTVYQLMGKLYQFSGTWAERGQGQFKLNVEHMNPDTTDDAEDAEELEAEREFKPKARFIMRNHLTHKVLLNTPIFKEMNLTIAAGGGGRVMFSSIGSDGKPIPYLFKCSKEDPIKALIREVKKIQEQL